MFRAVRHWWSNGSGGTTARLFLFEFVVVVLGVLVAQWLAGVAQDRAEIRAMERAKQRYHDEAAEILVIAQGWERAGVCLDERMTMILRLLASGQPVDRELLRRPTLHSAVIVPLNSAQMLLLRDRYGEKAANTFDRLSFSADRLTLRGGRIAQLWDGLLLVDPANGAPRPSDRIEARKAAVSIKGELIGLRINADNAVRSATKLASASRSLDIRPIRDCDDMWKTGSSHPAVEKR